MPARLRLSFEELGPTFVKFGQLIASRPDLVPQDYLEEMTLLQDQVQSLEFKVVEQVLTEELGVNWKKHFRSIEEVPLGSASIAQVHRAVLTTGEHAVIKVQRPGIVQTINDDLNVLYFIAELLERYIPEIRPFNPIGMIDEYFKTLELETNFVVEANNIRKFKETTALGFIVTGLIGVATLGIVQAVLIPKTVQLAGFFERFFVVMIIIMETLNPGKRRPTDFHVNELKKIR